MIRNEQVGAVTVLQMDHGKVNAMDVELCEQLIQALKAHEISDSNAIVLRGNPKVFSAGVNLKRVKEEEPSYLDAFIPALSSMFEAFFSHPKPVVVALDGAAIAGGCILACAADYRVMSIDAGRIGIPELRVGVPFPCVAIEIMRFVARHPYLSSMLFHGMTFTSEQAIEVGLIDEVTDPDKVMEQAMKKAKQLGNISGKIFSLTKRQLRLPAMMQAHQQKALESEELALWKSQETRDIITNFVETKLSKPK